MSALAQYMPGSSGQLQPTYSTIVRYYFHIWTIDTKSSRLSANTEASTAGISPDVEVQETDWAKETGVHIERFFCHLSKNILKYSNPVILSVIYVCYL